MKIVVYDNVLEIELTLDNEHADIDLRDEIGEQILELIETEQLKTALRQQDPDGNPWARLKPRTIKQKHSNTVGIRTGRMMELMSRGQKDQEARSVTWSFPADFGTEAMDAALAFHNGNPTNGQVARRLIGVSKATRAAIHHLLNP